MMRLGYKVAVVTGAAGWGAEAAAALAQDGAAVVVAGAADDADAAFVAGLRGRGLRAEYHHLDMAEPLAWAVLVDRIMRTHGHLDVLVNQAGAHISITIEDANPAQLREILDANLLAPFLGIKAVIAAMRQSGGGSIINIAANPVAEILPLYALYSAAKAGLVSLTKSTAVHCVQRGYDIRVNAIHPGAHETDVLTTNAIRSTTAPNIAGLLATLPTAAPAPLRQFAEAVTWLAADDSQHVTGTEIFCTGPLADIAQTAKAAQTA